MQHAHIHTKSGPIYKSTRTIGTKSYGGGGV